MAWRRSLVKDAEAVSADSRDATGTAVAGFEDCLAFTAVLEWFSVGEAADARLFAGRDNRSEAKASFASDTGNGGSAAAIEASRS